ncbi:DMT family transporter [Pseudooceanicola aestuarii]|uniref:DMT family transporter n=1 Tax=Pseudooceanicola aestuarii TaxID=2697319 RepID=UPI0013D2A525|nr:DMT family transporter [Pseudooceanicola aestuarii]
MRNPHLSGIALRLLSVFLMTAMSAAVHALGHRAELGQIMTWRSAVALLPILAYMRLRGEFPNGLRSKRPVLHLTRGLFGALSMALSFVSLTYLPVANAQALAYLAPVLTLPLAAGLLGERMSRRVPLAVALGFAGVILMLWTALEFPGDGALVGLLAGLGYALTMAFVRVHIKSMTATESVAAIAFWFAIVSAAVGLVLSPDPFANLASGDMVILTAAGLLGGAGHIAATEAVARAPVSTIAPFDFSGLIWAVVFDLVLFGLLPGGIGIVGMGAILAAGAMVMAQRPAVSAR